MPQHCQYSNFGVIQLPISSVNNPTRRGWQVPYFNFKQLAMHAFPKYFFSTFTWDGELQHGYNRDIFLEMQNKYGIGMSTEPRDSDQTNTEKDMNAMFSRSAKNM